MTEKTTESPEAPTTPNGEQVGQRLVVPWVDSVLHGDCLEIMADMPDGCIGAVITDPPYCSGSVS